MEVRKKEIEELQSQAQALSQEGKSTDEVDSKRLTVQTKFMELLEPLSERKHNLLASKEIHQFNRDVEDEIVSSPRASGSGRLRFCCVTLDCVIDISPYSLPSMLWCSVPSHAHM